MRVVLDTNVLVRATEYSAGGPAWELLRRVSAAPHQLISSPPLIRELADVLSRPHIRKLLAG